MDWDLAHMAVDHRRWVLLVWSSLGSDRNSKDCEMEGTVSKVEKVLKRHSAQAQCRLFQIYDNSLGVRGSPNIGP